LSFYPQSNIHMNDHTLLYRAALKHTQPLTQSLPVVSSSAVKWLGREGHHISPTSSEIKNKWSYTSPPSIYLDVGEYVLPRSPHVHPLQVFQHKPLLLVFVVLWSSGICHLVWYRCVPCHTVTRFS